MTTISVAVKGEVTATPGTNQNYKEAASGKWTADTVSYETYAKLKVNGESVIYEASCTFSFSGSDSSNKAVTGSEKVKLSAGTTKLQKGANKVLKQGDQVSDINGNKLEVNTSSKLRTT